MTTKLIAGAIGFIVIVFFSACGSHNCGEAPGLRISAVGFTQAELDTIVLRKYTRGSGFTHLIDSVIINNHYTIVNDTATAGSFYSTDLIYSKYDYEIFLPAVNKLFSISDIYEPQQKMKNSLFYRNDVDCINNIESFVLDGKTIASNYEYWNHYWNHLFLHR